MPSSSASRNHFVCLQSLGDDHVIVDDPARDSRSATRLTYAEARAMGYFHMRFVVS
jgi:predicted double-glycine peptidase